MDRQDAINYLLRKGKIKGESKYDDKEEKEINNVIKKGKIYGDPVVEIEA